MNADSKNPHAVGLGKLGAAKGGGARARELSAERREEIARQAARTRWHPGEPARADIQSKPAVREEQIIDQLARAPMSALHHDIDDSEPEAIYEIEVLKNRFRPIIAAGWRKGAAKS